MIGSIYLIVTIVMAGDMPNKVSKMEMLTLDDCWKEAAAWVAAPIPKVEDVTGLAAACMVKVSGGDP